MGIPLLCAWACQCGISVSAASPSPDARRLLEERRHAIERGCPGLRGEQARVPGSLHETGRRRRARRRSEPRRRERRGSQGHVPAPVLTVGLWGRAPRALDVRLALKSVRQAFDWFLYQGAVRASSTVSALILRGLGAGEGAPSQGSVVCVTGQPPSPQAVAPLPGRHPPPPAPGHSPG